MNWFDKNKFFEKLLVLFWVVFLFFCLWLLSFTSKASGLPYIVDSDNYTFGTYTMSDIESWINTKFINDGAPQYSVDFTNNSTIAYTYTSGNIEYLRIFTLVNDTQFYYFSNFSNTYDNFDTDTDTVTLTMRKCHSFILYLSGTGSLTWYTWYPNETQNISLFSQYYTPLFINSNFTNNTYINNVFVESDTIVLANSFETPIDIGVAIIPNFVDPNLDITTNYPNPPNIVTPSNPPTFDSNNIPQSTYNLIEWGLKDPNGPFQCLQTNLSNFFEYIGDCIEALGKSIINNIQNFMTNLYQNFVSLFEPLVSGVVYITQPLDTDVIYDYYNTTSFSSDVSSVKTNFTAFANQFNNITEPSSYKIPIHFENITMFSDVGVQYIDLGWLNSVKSLLRAFLWMVTTYGLLAAIFDAIPNYINGGGDESD